MFYKKKEKEISFKASKLVFITRKEANEIFVTNLQYSYIFKEEGVDLDLIDKDMSIAPCKERTSIHCIPVLVQVSPLWAVCGILAS